MSAKDGTERAEKSGEWESEQEIWANAHGTRDSIS